MAPAIQKEVSGSVRMKMRRPGATPFAVVAAVALLAGCSQSTTSGGGQPPPAQFVHGSVVLTPLGVQRLGLQTATSAAAGKQTIVPAGALLYESNGQTAVYTQTTPLIYTIRFITVATISGNVVVVGSGLSPGTVVVSQGAIELLGVQNGVGVET
jgi:predicted small secreted protein